MDDELLTLKEFARRTHYAINTVYNKISLGELTAAHGLVTFPSGRHRVDWSTWQAWLARRREQGPTIVSIGQCKRLACSQVFTAANKRQEYCSPACARIENNARGTERAALWRRQNPEKAHLLGHAHYVRKVEREKGPAAAKHVRPIRSRLAAAPVTVSAK